ncbi:MAG: tRNA-dihydrouridine synthase [Candidatus Gracilibacteria bacterium]
MAFSWENTTRPILALAPMSGYTDTAYRQLIKIIEPRTICFTEFTSADGLVYESKNTLKQLDFNPDEERPLIAQIFGKKPENFAIAAKKIEELGFDAIDINMGCPAKKVVSSDHGSALLKNPRLALEIIEKTAKATSLPVSVKTRIGVKEVDLKALIELCKSMESAGAKLITLHGRTAKQMYTGISDWEPIYEVKRHIKIPVIGNGDIRTKEDAINKINNLDGVMVGRATQTNMWLMAEIASAFFNESYVSPKTFEEKLKYYILHAELCVKYKGEERGIKEMRKHFVSLLRGFEGASQYRASVVNISTLEEAKKILYDLADKLKTTNPGEIA